MQAKGLSPHDGVCPAPPVGLGTTTTLVRITGPDPGRVLVTGPLPGRVAVTRVDCTLAHLFARQTNWPSQSFSVLQVAPRQWPSHSQAGWGVTPPPPGRAVVGRGWVTKTVVVRRAVVVGPGRAVVRAVVRTVGAGAPPAEAHLRLVQM